MFNKLASITRLASNMFTKLSINTFTKVPSNIFNKAPSNVLTMVASKHQSLEYWHINHSVWIPTTVYKTLNLLMENLPLKSVGGLVTSYLHACLVSLLLVIGIPDEVWCQIVPPTHQAAGLHKVYFSNLGRSEHPDVSGWEHLAFSQMSVDAGWPCLWLLTVPDWEDVQLILLFISMIMD